MPLSIFSDDPTLFPTGMTDTHTSSTSDVSVSAPGSQARLQALRDRHERLESYLRSDPGNNALLIDAFETAIACGAWERAAFHLQHALTLHTDTLAWRLREGDLWLAQEQYDQALEVLEALAGTPNPPAGFSDVVLHNLGFIEQRRGQFSACIKRLAPRLEEMARASKSEIPPVATRALQQLWLRALHHGGEVMRAVEWAHEAERNAQLDAQAAGIASLAAIDASDFPAAQRWAVMSMRSDGPHDHPTEALVAQASLALAARDAEQARQFAGAALQRNPVDGRAWSAMGFSALLAGQLDAAHEAFERALSVMGQHIGTWHGLGWTQILQSRLPAAQQSFVTALELDRNFAESHGGLAVALAMQGKREEAQIHVDLALRLDRANISGRYAQALLSGEIKDARDVQRLARRLLGGHAAPLGGDMAQAFGSADEGPASDRQT